MPCSPSPTPSPTPNPTPNPNQALSIASATPKAEGLTKGSGRLTLTSEAGGAAGGEAGGETEVEPTACKFGGAGCSFPFDEEQPGAEAPTEILIVRSSGTAATPGTTAGQEAAGSLAAGLEAAEAAGRIYSSVGEAVRAG